MMARNEDLEIKLASHMHWILRRLSYLSPDKPVGHLQGLIMVVLEDLDNWDRAINILADCPLKGLHLSTIRSAKGIVKAWRTYLIEKHQEQHPTASSPMTRPPSAATNRES